MLKLSSFQSYSLVWMYTKKAGAYKELFDRLAAKGKNKKLAVIAVTNKIFKTSVWTGKK